MRFKTGLLLAILLVVLTAVAACGGGGGGSTGNSTAHPGKAVAAGTITLDWDSPATNTDGTPLTDLAGYKIYYGQTPGNYTTALDVGNVATFVVNNLTYGLTYYFSVTAYNSAGVESSFSNEVSKTLPSPQVSVTTFMITASADIGGMITPAGTTGVTYGANQTFTIEPDAGYTIATVLVDGVSQGAVTTYTFTSVTANHTIAATFAQDPIAASNNSDSATSTSTSTSTSNSPSTSTFESGFDGYILGGFNSYTARDTTQAHTGSYSIVLYSGWTIYNDTEYPSYIYYGPANIYKTITTSAGTLSLWAKAAYAPGLNQVIRITSGGTTEEYALTESWAQYTKTVVGQTNDLIKIEFDTDPSANDYSAVWIDDVVIPLQ